MQCLDRPPQGGRVTREPHQKNIALARTHQVEPNCLWHPSARAATVESPYSQVFHDLDAHLSERPCKVLLLFHLPLGFCWTWVNEDCTYFCITKQSLLNWERCGSTQRHLGELAQKSHPFTNGFQSVLDVCLGMSAAMCFPDSNFTLFRFVTVCVLLLLRSFRFQKFTSVDTTLERELRATKLVQRNTGKELTKRLPHVMWW